MQDYSSALRSVLLFQILFPWMAAALQTGAISSSRTRKLWELIAGAVLACTSIVLLAGLILGAIPEAGLTIAWSLSSHATNLTGLGHFLWGIDLINGMLLCLLPWVHLTQIWGSHEPSSQAEERNGISSLWYLSVITLFLVGWDVTSVLCSLFLMILLLAYSIAQQGTGSKRKAASQFLTSQLAGAFLIAGGLGMAIACCSRIGNFTTGIAVPMTTFPELSVRITELLQRGTTFWTQSSWLIALCILGGGMALSACFPFYDRYEQAIRSAAWKERLWLLVWSKVLLIGLLRISFSLNLMSPWIAFLGVTLAMGGIVFSACSVWTGKHVLTSAFIWTQHLSLLMLCLLPAISAEAISLLMVTHLIGFILLLLSHQATLQLSEAVSKTQPSAINHEALSVADFVKRFRTEEAQSLSVLPLRVEHWLIMACWTLTPMLLGLIVLRGLGTTLPSQMNLWGLIGLPLLLMGNLLMLAGLWKSFHQNDQLIANGDFLQVSSSPQAERSVTLRQVSRAHQLMILWGLILITVGIVLPMWISPSAVLI